MPIFTQENNSCYFVHIPRTGGRYVSSLFENSKNVECKYHKINVLKYDGIDCTHLHYPLYNYHFGVENIPHIAVVRNPFDKFSSSIRNMHYSHKIDYNDILSNEKSFIEFIDNELNVSSFHNSWFVPQNRFVSSKTYIWKYEWGFGNNFKKWVFKKTKIDIDISPNVSYERYNGEAEKQYIYKLNGRVKKNIRRYYKKDYKMFRYFL